MIGGILIALTLCYSVYVLGGILILTRGNVRYLYYARVPALTAITVLGINLLAVLPGTSGILRNLYYAPEGWDSFWVCFGSLIVLYLAYASGQTTLAYGGIRFDGECGEEKATDVNAGDDVPNRSPQRKQRMVREVPGLSVADLQPGRDVPQLFFISLPALLCALTLFFTSDSARAFLGLGAALLSVVVAFFVADDVSRALSSFVVALSRTIWNALVRLFPGGIAQRILVAIERRVVEELKLGYLDPAQDGSSAQPQGAARMMLLPMHIRNTLFASLPFLLDALMSFGKERENIVALPALYYVFLMLSFACLALTGVTFFLDRFRIPLLIPLIAFVLAGDLLNSGEHVYAVKAAPRAALARPALSSDEPVILVAAAGGGIQAAGWTAHVLANLTAQMPSFAQHLRVISSVSGGSVGAMNYLGERRRGIAGTPFNPERVIRGAIKPSLDAVALGIFHYDFWTPLMPWRGASTDDRGRALDFAIAQSSGLDGVMLSKWVEPIGQGLPAIIFNSTGVESGGPVVFSTADLGAKGEIDNLSLKHDTEVATAARLSASFPFVSPVSRADVGKGNLSEHLADGGYYDNYGIASALEWLREAKRNGTHTPRVVMIQIISLREGQTELNDRSWAFQLIAPVKTLFSMRTSAQRIRAKIEFGLMQETYGNFRKVEIQFTPPRPDCAPPLSWKLSAPEIQCLADAWRLGQETWKKEIQQALEDPRQ